MRPGPVFEQPPLDQRPLGQPPLDQPPLDQPPLDRSSIAERVAGVLRERITEGGYPPGSRLSEEAIGKELKVSRNTLREAFRLLTHERLLVHEPYRGVSVRVLSAADVTDLYRVRAVIECGALAGLPGAGQPPVGPGVAIGGPGGVAAAWPGGAALAAVAAAVAEGERAEADRDWQRLGTANLRFHQALVALAGSTRLDELMRGILAELRLVFHVMADPRRFHQPYLTRNRAILARLEAADGPGAARLLAAYLADAERQLVDAYAQEPAEDPVSAVTPDAR